MGMERTLLERLADPEGEHDYRLEVDRRRTADSVLRHLQRMLNTRHGSAATVPEYGLPDFNDLAARFPDAINEISRSIRTCIETYEPRLTGVRIQHVKTPDDPLLLRYEISARLDLGDESEPIWLEASFGAGGKVRVRG